MEEQRLSNWGRWGEKDERGALNLLTPERVLASFGAARTGRMLQLALPLQQFGVPYFSRRGPCMHYMTVDGGDYLAGARTPGGFQVSDDYISISTHGTTHIDALCHVYTGNTIYNNVPNSTVRSTGARYCGVDKIGPIVTRGVLLDVAGRYGVEHLSAEQGITVADLEACEQAQGVKVQEGDVLLVRTGWLKTFKGDLHAWEGAQPGLVTECVQWLHERGVVAVGSDNLSVERMPAAEPDLVSPVHIQLLRNLGIYLLEMLVFEELAAYRDQAFLFLAIPLSITGGTASPLTPVAIV
jgi:kynurenine formamidase